MTPGRLVTVWPGARTGPGLAARALTGPVEFGGRPCVRVLYLEGRHEGGTDYLALTHAELLEPGSPAYHRAWRKANRESRRESCRRHRAKHREHRARLEAAHAAVRRALRDGTLERGPCEFEGSECEGRIESHHDDYDQPLVVRWVCHAHHRQLHGRRKVAA